MSDHLLKNDSSLADIKNIALRAMSKIEQNIERERSDSMVKDAIKDVVSATGASFSKRQFSDVITRSQYKNFADTQKDIYNVAQANNIADSFTQQLKNNNLEVSQKFRDKIALVIERKEVNPKNLQILLDKTIEKVNEQDFKINIQQSTRQIDVDDIKLAELETGKTIDLVIDDKIMGNIAFEQDKEVSGSLLIKNKEGEEVLKELMNFKKTASGYGNGKQEFSTAEEAIAYSVNSIEKAINTNRVNDILTSEIGLATGKYKVQTTIADTELNPAKQIASDDNVVDNDDYGMDR